MRITSNQIESFLQTALNKGNGLLLYGPDYGLSSIRMNRLKKQFFGEKIDQFRYFEYYFDELKEDENKLFNAITSATFFSGRKLIIIKNAPNSIPMWLKKALEMISNNEFIIIIADDLPPNSSLRKYFEDSQSFAAIPCYKDDATQIKVFIQQFFNKHQIKVSNEIIEFLESRLNGNRLIVENELNKLLLLTKSHEVTIENIEELIGSETDIAIDSFIYELFNGNLPYVIERFEQAILNESLISIIRFMLNHSFRLLELKEKVMSGAAVFDAMKTLRPPVFFKHQKTIATQVNNLTVEKIRKIVMILNEAEKLFKTTGTIHIVLKNKIFSIADIVNDKNTLPEMIKLK
ncbi:MAG: DNA polymerase III subunit delta [Sphingobacteriia bacterium]|nr:DNA polymerase III subunit delta [Sphingobacteriia bacterium]